MKKSLILIAIVLLIAGCVFLCSCEEGVSPVTAIAVTSEPVTKYYRGDNFNLNDSAITVYYENGRTDYVKITPSMISDFDSEKVGDQVLIVKYEGAVAYIKVTVSNAPVYSVSVLDGNYKKEYVEGQTLDVNDMYLNVVYNNGFSENIPISEEMVLNFDSTQSGFKELIVSYYDPVAKTELTAKCNITIVPKSIYSVEIDIPDKRNYVVGEQIDFKGARLFVAYNNNTSEYINIINENGEYFDKENFSVKIGNENTSTFEKPGTMVYVTVSYYGFEAVFYVTVVQVKAIGMELTKPIKQQQKNNLEGIDLSDSAVRITYNNGKTEIFELTSDKVEIEWQNFDLARNGNYKVEIRSEGLMITTSIDVVEPQAEKLLIDTMEKVYFQDGPSINVTDWKYRVLLTNGRYREFDAQGSTFVNVTKEMLEKNDYDFTTAVAGVKEYKFNFTDIDGKKISTAVAVEVYEKVVVEISEFAVPAKTVYFMGEELVINDGYIVVVYNDGSTKTVSLELDMLKKSVSEYTSVAGKINVDLLYEDSKYAGLEDFDYEITVLKLVEDISAVTEAVKMQYVLGESFDRTGLAIYITFTDKSVVGFDNFNGAEWTFEGEYFDEVGYAQVRVYYGDKSNGFYTVISDILVTNNVVGMRFADEFVDFGEVVEGLDITLGSDAKIVLTMESTLTTEDSQNGIKIINIEKFMLDYDRSDYTLGERIVNVNYEGFTLTSKVSVVSRKIVSVELDKAPEKTDYVIFDTDLDLNGLVIDIKFDNEMNLSLNGKDFVKSQVLADKTVYTMPAGFSRAVTITVANLDTTLEEDDIYKEQTVFVSVVDDLLQTGGELEFEIFVFKSLVDSIAFGLDSTEKQLSVFAREELVFPDYAYISVTFVGGDTEKVYINDLEADEYTVSSFDKNGVGLHSVTFAYLRQECTFVVNVLDKILDAISVTSNTPGLPHTVYVKEGMNISPDDVVVQLHYLRNDRTEYSPEYRPEISFNNVNCTFNPQNVEFVGTECVQTHTVSYTYGGVTLSQEIEVVITRKKAIGITMQQYPKDIYFEDGVDTKTQLDLSGGYVMVSYDNDTGERIALTSSRLSINDREFDTSELYDGSSRQIRIYVQFQDSVGTIVEVSFYVTVKDRKYLTAFYGEGGSGIKKNLVYGTGADAQPDFTINSDDMDVTYTITNNSGFELYYTQNGIRIAESFPKNVGIYKMVLEYVGDAVYNKFKNDDVTIEIIPKEITVVAESKTVTYGSVLESIDFRWETAIYINNGIGGTYIIGNPLLEGETDEEILVVGFRLEDRNGNAVDFNTTDGKTIVNIPAGTYSIIPQLSESLSDNYTVALFVASLLTVEKLDVKIVASHHEKTYGDTDMRFEYTVYKADENNDFCIPIGGYYSGNEGYVTLYDGVEGRVIDRILSYTLQRAQGENVGEYAITKGADGAISNYNIYDGEVARFVNNTLVINKKPLVINAVQAKSRKYGEVFTGEYWQNEYSFALETGYTMAWNEYFEGVFDQLVNYTKGHDNGLLSIKVYDDNGNFVDYFAPSVNAHIGNYTVKIELVQNGDKMIASNYDVVINDLSFTIAPMDVLIKISSQFITYSENPDGKVTTKEGDSKEYRIYDGVSQLVFMGNFDYDNVALPNIVLCKVAGVDVGKYEIVIDDSTVTNNPDFVFTSIGDYGVAYEEYFAQDVTLTTIRQSLSDVSEEDADKAFVVILPLRFTFDFDRTERYQRKSTAEPFFPNITFDLSVDAGITELLQNAFTFTITNDTISRSGLGYYTVDTYKGILNYNYFYSGANSVSKNFIAVAREENDSITELSLSNYISIYDYVFFNNAKSSEIIYIERFDYEITTAPVTVKPVNVSYAYTGNVYACEDEGILLDNGVAIYIDSNDVFSGDILNSVKYEISVKYFDELIQNEYEECEFVREAGDYSIVVTDVGNYNYSISEEVKGYLCQFTVSPIELQVCITIAEETEEDDVMLVSGIYLGRADTRLMSQTWYESNNPDEGYFYTNSHKIVNETTLTSAPFNLIIEPYYTDTNGVDQFPVNANKEGEWYDFHGVLTSRYKNYIVTFVRETPGGYKECTYKYVITPKKVDILNFYESGAYTKEYDTFAPVIRENDKTKLVIDGDVANDKVSTSDLVFTFERVFEIVENGVQRSVVPEKLRNIFIFDEVANTTYAGYFKVTVTSRKSTNYEFELDYPYYVIARNFVEVDLSIPLNSNYLSKQFDSTLLSVEQNELRITSLKAVEDTVNIELAVKYYKKEATNQWTDYDSANKNPIGLYAFDFTTYFLVPYQKDDGSIEYRKVFDREVATEIFGEGNEQRILSWNYTYRTYSDNNTGKDVDGVYHILPKDVNIYIPDSAIERMSVQGSAERDYYVHYKTYNNANVFLSDATNDLNSGTAQYTVLDVNGKELSRDLGFNRVNLSLSSIDASDTIFDAGEYFIVNLEELISNNENFNILNKNVLYAVGKLKVQLYLSLLDENDKSESIYGDSAYSGDIKKYTEIFDFVDVDGFASALEGINNTTKISDWISSEETAYNDNKFYIADVITNYYGLIDVDGNVFRLQNLASVDAGRYFAYLRDIRAKNFDIEIVGKEFIVKPKAIIINSAERDYFDKESISINYDIQGHVDENFENAFIRAVLAKFVDNTDRADDAGKYEEGNRSYYIYASKKDVEDVFDGYPNYTVSINETPTRPDNALSSYYYVALTIKKIDLIVQIEKFEMDYKQILSKEQFGITYVGFPRLNLNDDDYHQESAKQGEVKERIVDSFINWTKLSADLERRNASGFDFDGSKKFTVLNLGNFIVDNADYGVFINYNINWADFEFFINKIVLDFTIINNAGTTYNTEGYFSIIAGLTSEKLAYNETESGRLFFHFDISESEKQKIIGYDSTQHTAMADIFRLTWNNQNLPSNYNELVSYTVYQPGSDVLTAGRCYLKINNWYDSLNYVYNFKEAVVMCYPIVNTIGCQGIGGEIPYTALSLTGTEGDYIYNIENNRSMLLEITYMGLSSASKRYVDINSGLESSYYPYINHTANWSVEIVDKPASVKVGDELRLKLTFEEFFFNNEKTNKIESKEFIARIYSVSDSIVKTKADFDFVYKEGESNKSGVFSALKDKNVSYYLTDKGTTDIYEGNYDYIHTEFILGLKSATSYSYEQILFDDGQVKLILGFKGGDSFGYYTKLVNTSGTVLQYEEIGHYTIIDSEGNEIVRSILDDGVVNIFDGRRHGLSVYIDKVGQLDFDNLVYIDDNTTTVPRKHKVVFVIDDKYAYEFLIESGRREYELLPEGSYGAGEAKDKYTYVNYIDFSKTGKTGFILNECTAYVRSYTLKTMGIRLNNSGAISDVRLCPIDTDSILYVKNLKDIEELVGTMTINTVDGYDGKVYLLYNYTNTVTGQSNIIAEDAGAGLYRGTVTVSVSNVNIYSVSFYACVVAESAGTISFVDIENNQYGIYPDSPATISAYNNGNIGLGLYSENRFDAINYSKIRFDYSGTASTGSLIFLLKTVGNRVDDIEEDTGFSIEFIKNANSLYSVKVKLSKHTESANYCEKSIGEVDLEGNQNILETKCDYTNGTITIRLLRDGVQRMYVKINRSFSATDINEEVIRQIIGVPGQQENGGYSGIYMFGGIMTLYEYQVAEYHQSTLNMMSIEEGTTTGIGTPIDEGEIAGKNVLLADANGMALATGTKNTYLRFVAQKGGENSEESFNIMFANNTPYFFASEVNGSDLTGERGAMLIVNKNTMYISFYKYKLQWSQWLVFSDENTNFFDGKEHTIVICIHDDEEPIQLDINDGSEVEYYPLEIIVDGQTLGTINGFSDGRRIPVSNNLNRIMSSNGREGEDPEWKTAFSDYYDQLFVPSLRYVGIMPKDSKLDIKEMFVF